MADEHRIELTQVLVAANEQIGLALLDSHIAVEGLGSCLERLATLLSKDLSGPEAAREIEELRTEMARAVVNLQFYDRMAQHLTHVREYLSGTVGQLSSDASTFETLNRRLADRLLSDTHRFHLGRNFAVDFSNARRKAAGTAERVPQGDIDLF